MEDLESLMQFIRKIKSPQMVTNAVFTLSMLQKLRQEKGLQWRLGQKSAALFYPDQDNIIRLFFYAQDVTCLSEVRTLLPEEKGMTYVCDFIGKEQTVGPLVQKLEEQGFRFYARFQKMICRQLPVSTDLDLSEVEFAQPQDAEEIRDMLYQEFDPITAHFPSLEQIRTMIEEKEVFLIRGENCIAGFASFESNGRQVACLGYIITRPEYRGRHIARKLLYKKLLHFNQSKYYYLWVNEKCHTAIFTHEKNHFYKDGTYDYIFTV